MRLMTILLTHADVWNRKQCPRKQDNRNSIVTTKTETETL